MSAAEYFLFYDELKSKGIVMERGRRIIFAHGVHDGGGRVLLDAVMRVIGSECSYLMVLDARYRQLYSNTCTDNVFYFPPGVVGRLQAEFFLWRIACRGDVILSFNSIPFFAPNRARWVIFFQNVNLLDTSLRRRPSELLKSLLFRFLSPRVSAFIVQTNSVKRQLASRFSGRVEIKTLVDEGLFLQRSPRVPNRELEVGVKRSFIYVADDAPHKNHFSLMNGWAIFKEIFPDENVELLLTLTSSKRLWRTLSQQFNMRKLGVKNLGKLNREEIFGIYSQSPVLIYPSLQESLGLPLLEADAFGLDIIAADKDYVFDVVSPTEVFDPNSPSSIARSLARYLGRNWPTSIQPMGAKNFLDQVFFDV